MSVLRQHADAQLGRLARHLLGALGTGVDVAMPTVLVAELSDVDLKKR